MKTLAAVVALAALCAPAIAGTPQTPGSLNLHLVINASGAPRAYDVVVTTDHRCAMANQKRADLEDSITVCTSDEGRLDIEWWTRSAVGEYHSRGSVVLARGSSTELGAQSGPRLTITLQ